MIFKSKSVFLVDDAYDEVDDFVGGQTAAMGIKRRAAPAAALAASGEDVAATAAPNYEGTVDGGTAYKEIQGRRWSDGGYSYGFDCRQRKTNRYIL